MIDRRNRKVASIAMIVAMLWISGCEGGFVREAMRESFASFVINVFSTAVDETVTPE